MEIEFKSTQMKVWGWQPSIAHCKGNPYLSILFFHYLIFIFSSKLEKIN